MLLAQFFEPTAERKLPGVAVMPASYSKDLIHPAIKVREAGLG